MPEDGELFPFQIIRAYRHYAIYLVRLPFLPGAAIHPDLEMLSGLAHFTNRAKNGVRAHSMRPMRVGQVSSHINLSGLQTLEKSYDVHNVLRVNWRLGDGAGPV